MDLLRSIARAGLVLALLGGSACAGKVHDEVAPGYRLAELDSYAWVTEEPVLIQLGDSNPNVRTVDNERRLRAAIDNALAARGLAKVAFGEADVHVAFSVGTEARYRLEGGHDSWIAGLEPSTRQTKGTLHIYLLHPGDQREVWHGWTSKWLSKSDDPDTVVREAVAAIMARYPGAKPSK
jgi:Domain of unknown function (DUF4136)